MKKQFAVAALALALACSSAVAQQKADKKLSAEAARGKYLVQIAGCNDCHTPGYATSGGKVEEKLWLTGDQLHTRWSQSSGASAYQRIR